MTPDHIRRQERRRRIEVHRRQMEEIQQRNKARVSYFLAVYGAILAIGTILQVLIG